MTPTQIAAIEAQPYRFSFAMTPKMEARIGKRMKEQARAEGHRAIHPPIKQPFITASDAKVIHASIAHCLTELLKKGEMTHEQMRIATGIRGPKISSVLENLWRRGAITRFKYSGARYIYALVQK